MPWLRLGKRVIELRSGRNVIGRVLEVDIVLDDLQVSRRHAEIVVDKGRVLVGDLGSSNGTRVNGHKVSGQQQVNSGDVIGVGRWQLEFHETTRADLEAAMAKRVSQVETLRENDKPAANPNEKTATERSLDLMGDLALKALAIGRADEAERVLGPQLAEILGAARHGPPPAPELAERAAGLALRIAENSGRGTWIGYTLELYTALGRALPDTVVDSLYTLARGVPFDTQTLVTYLERLRQRQNRLSPSERFVLHRLEGLARMVSP